MTGGEDFWKKKKVFVTGHTGFKGGWLSVWLNSLGAEVTGYALPPPTCPSFFELCGIDGLVASIIADVRDKASLRKAMTDAAPEIVLHMAAQSLVRESYRDPVETYEINVLGTVNLLDVVRTVKGVKAVLIVTSDKCYENDKRMRGYSEGDPMGGYDPYSSSKGCAELVTSSYRNSFFNPDNYEAHRVALASARSGNVIGGGDWSRDRLLPDCVRGLLDEEKIVIRNPQAVRPWQHVLEPLSGYLLLAQRLYERGPVYSGGWNFGPEEKESRTVEWVAKKTCEKWGGNACVEIGRGEHPHEAYYLKLDCSKAKSKLGWRPRWDIGKAIEKVIEWTRAYRADGDLLAVSLSQIDEYSKCEVLF